VKNRFGMPITTRTREKEILERIHRKNEGTLGYGDLDEIYGILLSVTKSCPDDGRILLG